MKENFSMHFDRKRLNSSPKVALREVNNLSVVNKTNPGLITVITKESHTVHSAVHVSWIYLKAVGRAWKISRESHPWGIVTTSTSSFWHDRSAAPLWAPCGCQHSSHCLWGQLHPLCGGDSCHVAACGVDPKHTREIIYLLRPGYTSGSLQKGQENITGAKEAWITVSDLLTPWPDLR